MKSHPAIPPVSDAPDGLLAGHLWLFEAVAGVQFCFRLTDAGYVRFGDRHRVYDDPDEIPLPLTCAVRHVRENLERSVLKQAVADVTDVVFFGQATIHTSIDYDWARTPPFLGVDVWSGSDGAFRPLDTIADIFDRVGLDALNTVEREVRARDFDPDSYEFPPSAWYDGPVSGVLVRNKRGDRARLRRQPGQAAEPGEGSLPPDGETPTPEELTERFATRDRFERVVTSLEDSAEPVTVESLTERTLAVIAREECVSLYHPADERASRHFRPRVDMDGFRSALFERTRGFLADRSG